MRVSVDTNILVRLIVRDDERQAKAAFKLLNSAELIAIAMPCLCELAWVLDRVYKLPADRIATAIRTLYETTNIEMNHSSVEFGLAMLDQGGDFADAVIAYESIWLGGETFVSFDKKAVTRLKKQGIATKLLT